MPAQPAEAKVSQYLNEAQATEQAQGGGIQ